jgi:hypothetical protein
LVLRLSRLSDTTKICINVLTSKRGLAVKPVKITTNQRVFHEGEDGEWLETLHSLISMLKALMPHH